MLFRSIYACGFRLAVVVERPLNGLVLVVYVKFAVDVFDVALHGALGDEELVSYRLISLALFQ